MSEEDSRDGSLNFFKKLFQSPAEHKKFKIDKNRTEKGVINVAGNVNMTRAMTMKK